MQHTKLGTARRYPCKSPEASGKKQMKICMEENRLRNKMGAVGIFVHWPRALTRNCELLDFG